MIVFCSGMPRSASTWSYNVCRLLLQQADRLGFAGYVGEEQAVDTYLRNYEGTGDLVIKAHLPGEFALSLIQSNQAKNIYTYRDPRDSICSRLGFDQNSHFDQVLLNQLAVWHLYCWYRDNSETLFINYDEVMQSPHLIIKQIADYLNVELTPLDYEAIDQETNLEHSRKIADSVAQLGEKQAFQAIGHAVDRTTLLHAGHISTGKTGRWQTELDPEQQLITHCLLKPFLLELNYETETSIAQLIAQLMSQVDWQALADRYVTQERYFNAASLYEQAIEQDPEVKAHYWQLGLIHLLADDPETAQAVWLSGIAELSAEDVDEGMNQLIHLLKTEIDRQDAQGQIQKSERIRQCLAEIEESIMQTDIDLPIDRSPTPSVPLKLHIGGKERHPDWKILDVEPRPEVDFICDAASLDQFADNSVAAIYASHVLEHFYYGLNNELLSTLTEWHRVLQPGGKLYISVPNLRTLCWLYSNPNTSAIERHHLMRIIFGGQTNQYDVHKVGFDAETLAMYLAEAGFEGYKVVPEFGWFHDCSGMRILDTLISLNAIATK